MVRPPTIVGFDLDGTLIYSGRHFEAIVARVLAEQGKTLDLELCRSQNGGRAEEIYQALCPGHDSAKLTARHRDIEVGDFSGVSLFAETIPVLKRLRSLPNVRIPVITSRHSRTAQPLLEHLELGEYIDFAVFGDQVTEAKPHPEGILTAMEFLGGTPSNTIYVGDTNADIQAARAARVLSVYVRRMSALDPPATTRPHHTVPDLEGVLRFVRRP